MFAALGVFGPEREIEALDGLAAFVGEFGADAAFVFEAADLVASGAAVVADELFAFRGHLRIVHVIGGGVGGIGVLLRHQEAGDVARVGVGEAQAGHDGGLLNEQFVAVVGAARVIEIENVREIVFGVIFRAEIFFLVGAVGARALAGIVDPADEIIVIFFFADAAQVCGERAADGVGAFADGVAGEAAALVEQFLAVGCISGGLFFERWTRKRILPDEGGDGLDFVLRHAELRHFRGGAKFGGVADPVRDPFLVKFLARFFQVRADFLDFLQQIVAALLERFGGGIHARDVHGEVGGLRVVGFGGGIAGGGVAEFLQARDFEQVVGFGFREREDLLARVDELFVLIIEALEAVAADAAFLTIELLAFVEDGACSVTMSDGMALLATSVVIFGIVEWVEPVLVAAVPALDGINGASVAAVTGRAAEFFQRMRFQKCQIGMAGVGRVFAFREAQVGFGERDLRRNVASLGADVAGLAAIHEACAAKIIERRAWGIYVDLNDARIEIAHGVLQKLQRGRAEVRANVRRRIDSARRGLLSLVCPLRRAGLRAPRAGR